MDESSSISWHLSRRARVCGSWRAGAVRGTFVFSAGPLDDHLELEATDGILRVPAAGLDRARRAELELLPFANGQGLSILRPLEPHSPLAFAEPTQRVDRLVECLSPALPGLQLFPGLTSLEAGEQPEPVQPAAGATAALPGPETELTDSTQSLLARAATALEQGSFKRAEQAARKARQAGEAETSELLQELPAIRRAAKAVRRHPRDAQAHLTLGWGYFRANAGQAALRGAEEALRLDPNLGEAYVLVGLEHGYRADREPARAALKRAQALLPPDNQWLPVVAELLREIETDDQTTADPPPAGRLGRLWSRLLQNASASARWPWRRADEAPRQGRSRPPSPT
jgi:tetratricopeptide (TPR) repeat protein